MYNAGTWCTRSDERLTQIIIRLRLSRDQRLWLKSLVLGGVAGIGAGAAYLVLPPVGEGGFPAVVRDFLSWPLGLAEWAAARFGSSAAADVIEAAPVPSRLVGPLVAGATVWLQAAGLLSVPFGGRSATERVWPEPPDILDGRLFTATAEPHEARAQGRRLVARDEALATLRRFAGAGAGPGPRWTSLWGIEGVGKTKLALEWLAGLEAGGWDVGTLQGSPREIERAHFRRATAIVVDEAGLRVDAGLWEALARLMARGGRIRVLLVDQLPPERPADMPAADRDRLDAARWSDAGSALLAPLRTLKDPELAEIAPEIDAETRRKAKGRPRYVLLGSDPEATIAGYVERRLKAAKGDPALERILAFASLAPGTPNDVWPQALGTRFPGVRRLRELFGGPEAGDLGKALPPLDPEPVADGILLAWAADQLAPGRDDLLDRALEAGPAAAERRLGSLWSHSLTGAKADARAGLQARFDTSARERVEAVRQRARGDARRIVELLERLGTAEAGAEPRAAEARLLDAVRGRPFDVELARLESACAVDAIGRYGEAGRFEDLERWGTRLAAVAAARPDDAAVRLREAMGAVNAINGYGEAGRFEDLERWGARLAAVAAALPADAAVRFEEAKGAVNAIGTYAKTGRFEDLERWRSSLARVARDWPQHAEIQDHAKRYGVGWVDQYRGGWPYGPPQGT